MLERFRAAWARFFGPLARWLHRHNVSADVVTIVGTLGVGVTAAVCFPLGWLWQGAVIITFFVFSDLIDGQLAKLAGTSSRWGAFLDSSLDRLGDAAVFGGLLLFYAGPGHSLPMTVAALIALVMGQVTSYVKARAESLGLECSGGLAARADRLVFVLIATFLKGVGVPYVLEVVLVLLAAASTITVIQRVSQVRRQSLPARG